MLETLHPNERDCNRGWHPNLRVHKAGCARSGEFTQFKDRVIERRIGILHRDNDETGPAVAANTRDGTGRF